MAKLYIDSSSVFRTADRLLDGRTLASSLAERGYSAVVGMHTVYVLGSKVLLSGDTEKGMQVFSILRDLNAAFVPPTRRLLAYEVLSLRTGSPVVPFLLAVDRRAMQLEIERLARGIFDGRAEYFIRTREARSGAVEPLLPPDRRGDLGFPFSGGPGRVFPPPSPEDALSSSAETLPHLVLKIFGTKITEEEAQELALRLDDFPALRSAVLANLYWIGFRASGRSPKGSARPEDSLHLIDSAYCDALLTADQGLAEAASFIAPHILVLDWTQLELAFGR
jgi:hypothetical protein